MRKNSRKRCAACCLVCSCVDTVSPLCDDGVCVVRDCSVLSTNYVCHSISFQQYDEHAGKYVPHCASS